MEIASCLQACYGGQRQGGVQQIRLRGVRSTNHEVNVVRNPWRGSASLQPLPFKTGLYIWGLRFLSYTNAVVAMVSED